MNAPGVQQELVAAAGHKAGRVVTGWQSRRQAERRIERLEHDKQTLSQKIERFKKELEAAPGEAVSITSLTAARRDLSV